MIGNKPLHTKISMRRRSRMLRLASTLAITGVLGVQFTPPATAGTFNWTGGTDANWSNSANWNPTTGTPGAVDTAVFNAAAGVGGAIITTGAISLTALNFDLAAAAAYTVGGAAPHTGTITLTDTTAATISISATVAQNETVNADLVLGTAIAGTTSISNLNATKTLLLNGNITGGTGGTAAAKTLNFTGIAGGTTSVTGNISLGGASALNIVDSDAGTLSLSGTNTYTNLTQTAGTILLGSTGALSSTGTYTLGATGSFGLNLQTFNNSVGGIIFTTPTAAATLTLTGTGVLSTPTITFNGVGAFTATITGGTINLGAGGTIDATATANTAAANRVVGSALQGSNINLKSGQGISGSQLTTISGNNVNLTGNVNLFGILNFGSQAAASNQTLNIAAANSGIVANANLTLTNAVTLSNAAIFREYSGITLTLNGVLSGANGFQNLDLGTLVLGGANTFTGKVVIPNGAVSVSSINSVIAGATSSRLGAPTTVANGTIDLGSTATPGNLAYTGAGETTDRVINLAGTTFGGTLTQSGTGLLKYTSALTATGAGSKVLTLQGSTAAIGEFAGAIVDNSVTNTTGVTKTGTGTWVLSGTNTYTGPTTISQGVLVFNTPIAAVSTITVGGTAGNNATLSGSTTIPSVVVLAAGTAFTGAAINPGTVGTVGTLTLTNATGFTSNVFGRLNFDVTANPAGVNDLISSSDIPTIAGLTQINLNALAPLTTGSVYTLINGYTGSITGSNLAAGTITGDATHGFIVQNNANSVSVLITGATPAAAFWSGAVDGNWNTFDTTTGATNWRTTATSGTDTSALPGTTTDVHFVTTTPAVGTLTTNLGQSLTINSLTFDSTVTAATTVAGPGTLGINGAAGITSSSGTNGAVTISAPVIAGVAQTWTNNNAASALTFSGPVTLNGALTVTGAGNILFSSSVASTSAVGLTKTGAGTVTLSGLSAAAASNYSGATTIDAGTLAITTTSPTLTGALNFGLTAGSANKSALDLSTGSATFTGVATVQTNSATANTIAIGAGRTLTLNGGLTVGITSGALPATTTNLTVTGLGALAVNGTTLAVGLDITGAANSAWFNTSNVNVAGLANFSTNVTNLSLGVGTLSQGPGSLVLSNTANTLLATTITVGDSGANNGNGTSTLTLGTGTNVIQADALNIGRGKASAPGVVKFVSQTAGSPGTFNFTTNKAGTVGAGNITIANSNGTATAGAAVGTLDLSGHLSTVNINTLIIGQANSTSNTSGVTGTVNFDTGTFTVATLNMAAKTAASTGVAAGTLNVGGGTFTVNTAFTLGSQASAGTATAILNVTGGTFISNVPIVVGAGAVTSTINLNGAGAILDLTGHNIGAAGALVTNITLQAGTLQNLAVVNAGGALTKTTAGTLTLAGNNTALTSAITVNGGTLNVSTSSGSGLITINGSTTTLGTLNGVGVVGGGVTLATGGATSFAQGAILNPAVAGTAGTLTITGALTTNNFSRLNFDLNSSTTVGGGVNDLLLTSTLPVFGASTQVNINTLGTLTNGTTYTLISGYNGTAANFGNLVLNSPFTGVDTTHTGTLVNVQGAVVLVVGALGAPGASYWSGAIDGNWSTIAGAATNWRTDAAGNVDPGTIPGFGSDVHFVTTNPVAANLNTTLGQNFTIQTLTFDPTSTSPVTIGGPNTLTIIPASASTGITLASGAAAVSISAPLAVGANQTWTNNSGSLFTVGAVSGVGLTITGNSGFAQTGAMGTSSLTFDTAFTGTATLNQANTVAGVVAVNGGTVIATSNAGALGAGTLSLGGGALRLTNASGANLTFGRNTTVTASSTITSDVTSSGAGDTFTLGNLAMGPQTLTISGGANVNGGTAGVTFGAVTLTGNPTFTTNNPAGGGVTLLTLGAVSGSGFNLTFNGSGSASVNGVIGTAAGNVSIGGTSTLTLAATNTFTGGVTLGATAKLNFNSTGAAGTGTLTINGGTLDNTTGGTVTNATVNPLALNGDFSFGGTQSLSLGTGATTLSASRIITANGTGTLTLGGAITGATFNITKAGPGTVALTGVIGTTTGGLALTGGTLIVGNAANTFTGPVSLDGASTVLQVTSGSNGTATAAPLGIFTGGLTIKQITLTNGATFQPNATWNFNTVTAALPGAGYQLVFGAGGGFINTPTGVTLTLDDGTAAGTTSSSAEYIANSGTTSITKIGVGQLTLRQQNVFTASVNINAGTVFLTGADTFGVAADAVSVGAGATLDIGAQTNTRAYPLTLSGTGLASAPKGALTSSTGTGTWVGPITIATGGATISGGAGTLTLSAGATINTQGNVVTFNTGSTANLAVNGVISGAGSVAVTTTSTGQYVPNMASTYTGGTTFGAGTRTIPQLNSVGNPGAVTSGPFGTGSLTFVPTASIRASVGSAQTIANSVILNGGIFFEGAATENNFTFTGPVTLASSSVVNSTVGTVVAGRQAVLSGVVSDGGNAFSLTKTGGGNLVLGGANTYTGGTIVSAGLLSLTGSVPTGTLLTVAGGASFSLQNNAANPLLNISALSLGTAATNTNLYFDLGAGTATSDELVTPNAALTAGTITVNINGIAGFATNPGTYTLLSAAGGLDTATYVLGNISGSQYSYSLSSSPTAVILTIGTGAANNTGNLFWRDFNGTHSWAGSVAGATNWSADLAGTINAGVIPGTGNTVVFSATAAAGPAFATTLDANFTVNDVQFTAVPAGVTSVAIAGGSIGTNSLTIAPSSSTTGITLAQGAGAVTISAPVVLGTAQTWTVDNTVGTGTTSALTVSGAIGGAAAGGVTFAAGNGSTPTITLSGANTYSGPSTVNPGVTLQNGATGGLSPNTSWTVNGTLNTGAFSPTTGSLSGSGLVQDGSATAATLIIGNDNAALATFAGTIQNGSTGLLAITKVGTGTQAFSGTGTYTGNTLVNAGTLMYSTGATSTTAKLFVGNAGGSGAVIQRAGTTLNIGTATSGTDVLSLGLAGGYGYYLNNGGTLNTGQLAIGSGTSGTNNTGVFEQNGGSTTVMAAGGFLLTGWTGTNANGVLNIFNGTVTNNSTTNDTQMGFTASLNSFGMFNLLGSGALFDTTAAGATRVVDLAKQTGNFAGVLNLNAGTLLANSVKATNAVTPTFLGLNGGTLKANSANTTFITGITAATIYSGGAIIDTNNFAVTVPQALLAPTGSGLTGIPVTSGGAGYIGAPAVRVTGGGGTGATAIAVVDLNSASPTFGQITGFTITSAGNGYTSAPTITLIGGGATTAATLGTATTAANATTGGLTKIGLGTLTLGSPTSTFVGGVTINNGSVTLGANSVIPTANTVTVNAGSFDLITFNNTVTGLVLNAGAVTSTTGILTSNTSYDLRGGSVGAILQGTNGVTKTTPGIVTLGGVNLFTGTVNITGGTLAISSDTQLGAAANGVTINNTGNAVGAGVPALQYNTNATLSTARAITIGAGGGNIDVVNGGTLSVTNPTGLAPTSAGVLNKTGLGTLTFTNPVATTSGTAGVLVTAGTLNANFGNSGISSIAVGTQGKLNLIGGPTILTLSGAGNLSLTGGAQLGFELGDPTLAVTSDEIIAKAAAVASGAITLNLIGLTGFGEGTYNLIADANGGLTAGGASYVLGSVPSNSFNYTIAATDNLVTVTLQSFSGVYWNGAGATTSWTAAGPTNFSLDAAGTTDLAGVPNQTQTVVFSAANAPGGVVNTTLNAAFTIDSLQFNGIGTPTATTSVTIAAGAGGTLTLDPASASGGINILTGGGNVTISAPLTATASGTNLSGQNSETWNVTDPTSTLTVSGPVTFNSGITKAGAGKLVLSGNNTGTGRITLNAGEIDINSPTALGGGAFVIGSGTTIDNTSGAAISMTSDNPQTWVGDFTFKGGAGTTHDLNLGAGAVSLTNSLTLTTTAGTLTVGGVISGAPQGITKAGAGTLMLAGNNSYGGLTTVNAGVLTLSGSNSGAGGVTLNTATLNINNAAALGTGPLTINGGTIDNGSGGAETITSGSVTISNSFTFTGTNDLNLGTGPVTLTGTPTITTTAGTLTFAGNITGGSNGLTKAGAGSIVVSGATNTYGGVTTVSAGTMTLSGSLVSAGGSLNVGTAVNTPAVFTLAGAGSYAATNGNINVGSANSGTATSVINVVPGTSLTATANGAGTNGILQVASATGGSGVVNQSGGAVSADAFFLAQAAIGPNPSYGFYNQTGGTFTDTNGGTNARFRIANSFASNVGLYYLSGGTATLGVTTGTGSSAGMDLASSGTASTTGGNPIGVIYISGTGQMTNLNAAGSLQIGNTINTTVASTATGQLTIGGAGSTAAGLTVTSIATSSGTAGAGNLGNSVINLLGGGTLTVGNITKAANGTSYLNFNGGTLKVGTTGTTLAALTGAYSYSGGANIDTNGLAAYTVASGILTPTLFGVGSIDVGNGGSGYVGAPAVIISGGAGTGATAIAQVSGGVVTGIVITNPGTGYASTDTPTVTLSGGGATTAASAFNVNLASNTSGGLTKNSAGSLILTGTSTYTGTTTINAGTLQLGGATATGALSPASAIIDNGVLAFNRITNPVIQGTDFSSAPITGTGSLVQSGTTALTLNVANAYLGGTTVNGTTGSIVVTNNNALSSGPLALKANPGGTGITFQLSGGVTIANPIAIDSSTGREAISSTNGSNILNSPITVSAATANANTIILSSDGAAGTTFTVNGNLTAPVNYTGTISVRGTLVTDLGVLNGQINAPGAIFDNNVSGVWTINSTGNVWAQTQMNSAVAGSGLTLGATDALVTTVPILWGATAIGTVDLKGFNQTVAGIAGTLATPVITNSGAADSTLTLAGLTATQNYTGVISNGATNKVNLTLNSAGKTQVLSGASTYTGPTAITAGTLQLGNAGTTGSLSPSSAITIATGSTLAFNRTNAMVQGTDFSSAPISGLGGILQAGTGTTALTATNTYQGVTTITAGQLLIGNGGTAGMIGPGAVTVTSPGFLTYNRSDATTLGAGNLVTGTGGVQLNSGTFASGLDGQFAVTGALLFGSADGATPSPILDLTSGSSSFGGLTVRTSSSGNTITVGAGKTLAITGNVQIGPTTPTVSALTTKLTIAGSGGSLNVTTPAAGVFQVGGNTSALAANSILDLSGLTAATINLTPTGALHVSQLTGTNLAGNVASLLLPTPAAGVTSTTPVVTITAGSFSVGDGSGNNGGAGQTNSVTLGTGLTTLNVDTVNVGTGGRDFGQITFAPGNGTFKLRGSDGTSRVAFNVGTGTANTAAGPGAGVTNNVDFTGHSADLLLSTLSIGAQNRNTIRLDTFTMNTGTLDATAVVLATNSGTANGTALTGIVDTSNLNIAGTTTATIGAGGLDVANGAVAVTALSTHTLVGNVNLTGGSVTVANNPAFGGAIRLSNNTIASGLTTNGFLNLTGGSLVVAGDIIKGASTGPGAATITLDGSTLDLGGHNIGSSTALINTVALASGTLKNVAEINGGGVVSKTTSGTLNVAGVNTWSGATTVVAGTFSLTGSLGNVPVGVNSAATFAAVPGGAAVSAGTTGAGTGGAVLTLNPGSLFNMADGQVGTFNLQNQDGFAGNNNLVIGGAAGAAPVLTFDVGSTTSDKIIATKGVSILATGGSIAINILPTATTLAPSYTLITAASGLSALSLPVTTYVAGGHRFTGSLSTSTATQEVLTFVGLTTSGAANLYWGSGVTGSQGSAAWNGYTAGTTNWSSTPGSFTNSNVLPGTDTTVNFSVTSPTNSTTTLGENMNIAGLNLLAANTAPTSITGSTLTVAPGSSAAGITQANGAGTTTISSNVVIGASQTWSNADVTGAAPLVVSGVVSNGNSPTPTLTIAGAGIVSLTGNNTAGLSAPITVDGGRLRVGADNTDRALGVTTNTLTLTNGGALVAASSFTVSNTRGVALTGSGGTFTAPTTGTTLTVAAPITGTALSSNGSGTLALTNANTYSGGTTVVSGLLLANNTSGSATGDGAVAVGAGGALAGKGTITGPVTLTGGSISGGTSIVNPAGVGALTVASAVNFTDGSTYVWKVLNGLLAGPTAVGTAYDVINAASISLAGVTGPNVTLKIVGSDNLPLGVPGSATQSTYRYELLRVAGLNSTDGAALAASLNADVTFAPDNLALAATPGSFSFQYDPGTFTSQGVGQSNVAGIDLVYTPTPEPVVTSILGLAALALVRRPGRQRRQSR